MKNQQKENAKTILAFAVFVFSGLIIFAGENNNPPIDFPESITETSETSAANDEELAIAAIPITDSRQYTSPKNASDINQAPKDAALKTVGQQFFKQPAISPFVQETIESGEIVTKDNKTFPLRNYKTQSTPDDPSYLQPWVQTLNLPELWETNTGTTDTLLAIIDTGFALQHEEFEDRWHVNTNETGATLLQSPSKYNCSDQSRPLDQNCNLIDDNFDGIVDNETGPTTYENSSQLNCTDQQFSIDKSCNLVDDDNNGLIDDYRGWDFVNFDNSPQAGEIDPNGSGTHHGSYVTGVAAANANNGVGIAGVNWQTKILPLQGLADTGSGTSISVARSIRYAVNQRADVISLSLGGEYPDTYTRIAIEEALAAGVIVVAASGNDGCDCISYPANYPEVIAVGALNSSGRRAAFSSYGDNLDIMAPGTGIYTTSWSPSNGTTAYAGGTAGTSLATPQVSGLITSLIGANPDASPLEITAALLETANRLSIPTSSPRSTTLGFGMVDAQRSNDRLINPISLSQLTTFSPVSLGNYLNPASPAEPVRSTRLYQCQDTTYGTTAIHRLRKNNSEFYTASLGEVRNATQQGYSSNFLGYACAIQQHDNTTAIRNINVYSEFSNRFTKQ